MNHEVSLNILDQDRLNELTPEGSRFVTCNSPLPTAPTEIGNQPDLGKGVLETQLHVQPAQQWML